MNLRNIPRLVRTVRHLHWSQPVWRVHRCAQRRFASYRPARRVSAAAMPGGWTPSARLPWLPPPPWSEEMDLAGLVQLERGVFCHLHQCRQIGRAAPDWRLGPQSSDRLWTVTLHYHEWVYNLAILAARGGPAGARAATALGHFWLDWIKRCDIARPAARPLAWNPYAIATRLTWWLRACRLLGEPWFAARRELRAAVLASYRRQAEFLRWQLEWDLRGNHLLRDAVGLAAAGRFLQGRQPARWLALATDLTRKQVAEQVLADGAHFERSPMYHLEVMHDLLVLAQLLTSPSAITTIRRTWRAMAEWAAWSCHADGLTAQLNDGARRAVNPELALGRAMGIEVAPAPRRGGRHLEASGIVAWHGDPWTVLFDVGLIGPRCQPGHGHADTLTLESSYAGHRLFVDPGSRGYDNDRQRRHDRATRAHNTVCVDGTDSSEVWHIFRVGRRARPHAVRVALDADGLTAEATHDGYDHLPGQPRHRRRVTVCDGGALTISDRVTGRGQHCVEGGLLLAPAWAPQPAAGGWQLVNHTARLRVDIDARPPVTLSQEPAVIHPAYGTGEKTTRLVWRYRGVLPITVKTTVVEVCKQHPWRDGRVRAAAGRDAGTWGPGE